MLRSSLLLIWLALVAASPATDEARRLIAQNRDAEAFQRVETASRRGDDDATALLGWFYDNGRHVQRDHARAVELYRRVMRDNPSVQWRLGVMYDTGQGVPANPQEAVRLFRQAAADDDANAHASLGVMYYSGRGVPRDYGQAMRYSRRAAQLGSPAGFLGVGVLFHQGLGVPAQRVEAGAWYLSAQALRDTRAAEFLARLQLSPQERAQAVTRGNQLLQSFNRRERVAATN